MSPETNIKLINGWKSEIPENPVYASQDDYFIVLHGTIDKGKSYKGALIGQIIDLRPSKKQTAAVIGETSIGEAVKVKLFVHPSGDISIANAVNNVDTISFGGVRLLK